MSGGKNRSTVSIVQLTRKPRSRQAVHELAAGEIQLDAQHQPPAAYLFDKGVALLEALEAVHEVRPHPLAILQHAVVVDGLERRHASSRGQRIAAERRRMRARHK